MTGNNFLVITSSWVGSGNAARKVGKEALEKLAKELGMSTDEILKIAEEVAKEYKMSSIDDIKALKGKLSLDGFVSVVKGKAVGVKYLWISQKAKISQKIANDYIGRWWNENLIRSTISNPYTTRIWKNKATGNTATVFYQKDGSYASVDDITLDVIQISKIWDKNWIPDSTIINPYRP